MELLEIKMENYQLSRFLPRNKILDYISALDEDGLTTFVIHNADDYGVYLVTLLAEVAKKKTLLFGINTWEYYVHLIYFLYTVLNYLLYFILSKLMS